LLSMPEPLLISVLEDPVMWLLSTVAVHSLRYEHALSTLRTIVGDPAKLVEEKMLLKNSVHESNTPH